MSSLRYLEIVARHRNQRNLSLSKESKKSKILPKKVGPEPTGKGLVVNNIPTPSPNWTLLRLRPLPIVRNSKNARCSTTCLFQPLYTTLYITALYKI